MLCRVLEEKIVLNNFLRIKKKKKNKQVMRCISCSMSTAYMHMNA